jgi:hypothetical protein
MTTQAQQIAALLGEVTLQNEAIGTLQERIRVLEAQVNPPVDPEQELRRANREAERAARRAAREAGQSV